MTQWGRRIRASIGMGLTWAIAWGAAGGVLARIPGFYSDLPFPLIFAPLGFLTGVLFSGILVGVERRRGLDHASLGRFSLWGAASGLLLTGVIVAGAIFRGDAVLPELLLFGPPLTIASASCAAGSLALARRAQRTALNGGTDNAELGASDAVQLPHADE